MKRQSWADRPRAAAKSIFSVSLRIIVVSVGVAALSSCATQITAKQAAQVYYDLGNAYSKLGEQDKATAAYLNALKLDSTLLQASYNLARAYIESGSFDKAIALLNNLLAKDPENVVVLDTLGFAYYKKGDREHALSYYDQVLNLSPVDENALYNKALILEEQGKSAEAIKLFDKLYKLNNKPSVLLILGKLELKLGNNEDGIRYLAAYIQAKPDDFDGLTALGNAYRDDKLYDKALTTYNEALKIKPEASGVLFAKAEILLTAIQDQANGIKALSAALDAGFSDRKALDALLGNSELVGKHAVEELLKNKGLQPANAPAPATPPPPGSKSSSNPTK